MGRARVAPAEASFLSNHRGVVIHGDTRVATCGCFVFRSAFDASARQWGGCRGDGPQACIVAVLTEEFVEVVV